MSEDPQSNASSEAITRMERGISTILRTGVLISLTLVIVGIGMMFIHHPEYMHSPEALGYLKSAEHKFPTTLGAIARGVLKGEGRSIVLAGVFVLFITPVLRVAASVITFAQEKDRPFTVITALVLLFVLLSLVLGKAG